MIIMLSPFYTKIKIKGDKGNPWCKNLDDLKETKGDLLMRTAKEEDSIHPMIQLDVLMLTLI
jgi:hypothetical protein